ncbi:MAG: sigma-70 family RNA polymerase sigma factor [Candidatus Hydrogenedentes bacterium]|nr:sigma-70 family RNA polymerase sigma factor [Candidatus Hydrogenedentota bacterium]
MARSPDRATPPTVRSPPLSAAAKIARQLGLKESRVRMRLQRGLKLLQKCHARQGIDSRTLH